SIPITTTGQTKIPARSSRQRAGYDLNSTKAGKTPQKAAVTAFQNRTLRAPFSPIPNASAAVAMFSTYLHWRAELLLPLPQFQCKACAIPGGSVRILGFSQRILRNPNLPTQRSFWQRV